jgi:membrane glycosyltransferase
LNATESPVAPAAEMPVRRRGRRGRPWRFAAYRRRTLYGLLVFAQTIGACFAILAVLPYHGSTVIEKAIVLVSAVLFGWISAGFWMALMGFFWRRLGGDPHSPARRLAPEKIGDLALAPTAVVYPIYHEDVQRTLSGLYSTWRDLERTGQIEHFEFFVLSDSRDPAIWLAEREAVMKLRELLGPAARIHYRRRVLNLNRKTGNVSDFLRRWGRRFRYMIVMDADSVMKGEALVRMVRIMQADDNIGILQSAPSLINSVSAHARIQQFANRLYGPIFTDGLAALQLGEAVFWGHNAVIRVEAFMANCGLPHLRGWGFLRGSVLSHDFVEAACMWRAGYEVWLDASIDGSYEESPPTLGDELERDRRWAHGNLQHLYFLFRRGISSAHRAAFANGIMAYVASALWFGYLVLITLELAQFTLKPIEYFPDPDSPFPVWPEWQPEWAVRLAFSTLFILFAPKLLALLDLLFDRERRRQMGGVINVAAGMVVEMVVSMLLAPIRMLSHTRYVIVTLFNLQVRWAGQNRTEEEGWGDALLHHAPGSILAVAWAGFAYWLQPLFFYWSLPIAIPLLLAAPVSVWLSRFSIGRRWRERNILLTPEESTPPAVVRDLLDAPPLRDESELDAFAAAVINPARYRFHRALARQRGNMPARVARREHLLVRALAKGPGGLNATERSWLMDDAIGLGMLHRAAWMADANSPWGRLVGQMCRESGA